MSKICQKVDQDMANLYEHPSICDIRVCHREIVLMKGDSDEDATTEGFHGFLLFLFPCFSRMRISVEMREDEKKRMKEETIKCRPRTGTDRI